jgi:hypothetical protein
VAVDDAEPFYNVFGGTQDNGTHAGPSRTAFEEGIRNADWAHILGGDGHQTATEPGNPRIVYGESQQGYLFRIDRITGEQVFIQPQPGKDEPHERFNWDTPILVSAHDPARIYTASYRVWRSENRGDSWTTISGDLTRGLERIKLPIMDRKQSWDNPWDIYAMSNYSTITSLAESPVDEKILYAGTDDGSIQATTDGGESWRKTAVGSVKGIPPAAFVNDVRADLFDAKTVYAALDNHKYGDFKPYIIKSTDAGKNWKLISGNISDRTIVWRLVQDHEKKELLFAATEFGVWFTIDGGASWTQLKGGLPTISFRDITIQRRENDLVAASFGRGFYILDDIAPLRKLTPGLLEEDAVLFDVKDAWLYQPKSVTVSPGASEYRAENPPFGAVFTFYLKEDLQSLAQLRKEQEKDLQSLTQLRKEKEKELNKGNADIPFPGWEAVEQERDEDGPFLLFTIRDEAGNIVNHVQTPAKKGIKRVSWDLRYASKAGMDPDEGADELRVATNGYRVPPGSYSVSMYAVQKGEVRKLTEPVTFRVKPLYDGVLEPVATQTREAFRKELDATMLGYATLRNQLADAKKQVQVMKNACFRLDENASELLESVYEAEKAVRDLDIRVNGLKTKTEVGEKQAPALGNRMSAARQGLSTSYGPTQMHRKSLDLAKGELQSLENDLENVLMETLPGLEKALREAGAPIMR